MSRGKSGWLSWRISRRTIPTRSSKERVLKILAEYRVRAVSSEQIADFAEEVQREAH